MVDRDGRPDFKISSAGSPIANDLVADVIQITVDDMLDGAAVATIKIRDAHGARSDGSVFAIGSELKIELGYVGSLTEVFAGEVTGWRGAFPRRGGQTLTVVAQCKFHRMRRNKRQKTLTNMKDSDAVSQAAQACGLQVGEVEATTVTHEAVCQWNLSDADFILERAKAISYEAFVKAGKLVFRKPKLDAGAATTLERHKSLRSFTAIVSLAGQGEVKVSSWDMKLKKPTSATAKKGKERSLMGGAKPGIDAADQLGAGTQWYPQVAATTQAELDAAAQAIFQKRSEGFVEGEGSCEGDPAILKGEVIQLDGLGDFLSGTYYVKRAIHTLLQGSGYLTTFYVKRTSVKKPPAPPPPEQTEAEQVRKEPMSLLDPEWVPPGGIVANVVDSQSSVETEVGTTEPGMHPEIDGETPEESDDKVPVQKIRFKIEDQDGTPIAGKPFSLVVDGCAPIEGTTAPDGYVLADVPLDAKTGELTFWLEEDKSGESYTWPLRIADHTDKGKGGGGGG